MKKRISLILKEANEFKVVNERVAHILKHDNIVLQGVLKVLIDPNIKLDLPDTVPPYKPNEKLASELEERLYADWRKMYLFFKESSPAIADKKREMLFIEYLEGLHPADAELVASFLTKKSPYNLINITVARKAYPALFPNETVEA